MSRTETKLYREKKTGKVGFVIKVEAAPFLCAHLIKLILARRETFLYKQSGVVTNCKWENVLLKIDCSDGSS